MKIPSKQRQPSAPAISQSQPHVGYWGGWRVPFCAGRAAGRAIILAVCAPRHLREGVARGSRGMCPRSYLPARTPRHLPPDPKGLTQDVCFGSTGGRAPTRVAWPSTHRIESSRGGVHNPRLLMHGRSAAVRCGPAGTIRSTAAGQSRCRPKRSLAAVGTAANALIRPETGQGHDQTGHDAIESVSPCNCCLARARRGTVWAVARGRKHFVPAPRLADGR